MLVQGQRIDIHISVRRQFHVSDLVPLPNSSSTHALMTRFCLKYRGELPKVGAKISPPATFMYPSLSAFIYLGAVCVPDCFPFAIWLRPIFSFTSVKEVICLYQCTNTLGPRPLEQCRVRSVEVCASTSVDAAASRTVELQTWYRKHTPPP
jgi:hypothetical protein